MTATEMFLDRWVTFTGNDSWTRQEAGVYVCPDASRVGTGRVSACRVLGQGPTRTVLRVDPNVADWVAPLAGVGKTLSDDDFVAWANHQGAKVLGSALMKTLPAAPSGTPSLMPFLRDDASHRELLLDFMTRVDDDELDDAEIEMDNLDELAVVATEEAGAIVAFASARPFDEAPDFGDIGVAVDRDQRRRGLGSHVVNALVEHLLLPNGMQALYRCDHDNPGSDGLSRSLGFDVVLDMTVIERPSAS